MGERVFFFNIDDVENFENFKSYAASTHEVKKNKKIKNKGLQLYSIYRSDIELWPYATTNPPHTHIYTYKYIHIY